MKVNILYIIQSGQIVSAGYCYFVAGAGQGGLESENLDVIGNIGKYKVESGNLIRLSDEVIAEADLALKKASAIEEIYNLSEKARGKRVTLRPGKIWEYRIKQAEYERWVAAGSPANPDGADYPIADKERLEYTPTKTIPQMVQIWGSKAAADITALSTIARMERRALIAVQVATEESEIITALTALQNALS